MPELNDINYPRWVNWVAQDADGSWWGFSVEPLEHTSGWYENEVGQYQLLYKDPPNPDWKKTLRKVN